MTASGTNEAGSDSPPGRESHPPPRRSTVSRNPPGRLTVIKGKTTVMIGKTTAIMGSGWRWWRALMMFLDLTTDRVKSRALNSAIFLLVFSAVASIFFPFLVQDPALKFGTDTPFKIDVVKSVPERFNFRDDLPDMFFRIVNEKNFGVEGLKVALVVSDFTAEKEIMPDPLRQSGLRCSAPYRERTLSWVREEFFFCASQRVEGCTAVTDKFGFAKISGCRVLKGFPGVFTFSLMKQPEDDSPAEPFSCNYCETGRRATVTGTVAGIKILEANATSFENIQVGKPLAPFKIQTIDASGEPTPNRECVVGSWSLEGVGDLFRLVDRTSERHAIWSNNIRTSDADGIVTFEEVTCVSSNNPYTFIFVVCEGQSNFLPFGETGFTQFKGLLPISTNVKEVSIIEQPGTGGLDEIIEGTALGTQPSVRVLDENGDPVVGRYVFAMVAEVGGFQIPAYYQVRAPGRSQFRSVSDSQKRSINLISEPTDENGVARWTNLGVTRSGPVGPVRFRFICDGVVSGNWSEAIPIKSSVKTLTVAGNPVDEFILGAHFPSPLTVVVRDFAGQPIYGKIVKFRLQHIRDLRWNNVTRRAERPIISTTDIVFDYSQKASDEEGLISILEGGFRGGIPGNYSITLTVDGQETEPNGPIWLQPRPFLDRRGTIGRCDIRVEILTPLPSQATAYRPITTVPRYRFTDIVTGRPIVGESVCLQTFGPSQTEVSQLQGALGVTTDSNGIASFPGLVFAANDASAHFQVLLGDCGSVTREASMLCTAELSQIEPEKRRCSPVLEQCIPEQEPQLIFIEGPVKQVDLLSESEEIRVQPGGSLEEIAVRLRDAAGNPLSDIPCGAISILDPSYFELLGFQWFMKENINVWLKGEGGLSDSQGIFRLSNYHMAQDTPPGKYVIAVASILFVFKYRFVIEVSNQVARFEMLSMPTPDPGSSTFTCGRPLANPPRVRFVDRDGNPVAGARLTMVSVNDDQCFKLNLNESKYDLNIHCAMPAALIPPDPDHPISKDGVLRDASISAPSGPDGIAEFKYLGFYGAFLDKRLDLIMLYANGPDPAKWLREVRTLDHDFGQSCNAWLHVVSPPPEQVSYGTWSVPGRPPLTLKMNRGGFASNAPAVSVFSVFEGPQPGSYLPMSRYERFTSTKFEAYATQIPNIGAVKQPSGGLMTLEPLRLRDTSLTVGDADRVNEFRIGMWTPGQKNVLYSDWIEVSYRVHRVEILQYPRLTTSYSIGDTLEFVVRASLKSGVGIPKQTVSVAITEQPGLYGQLARTSLSAVTDTDGKVLIRVVVVAGELGEYQFQFTCGGKKSPPSPALTIYPTVSVVDLLTPPAPLTDGQVYVVKPGDEYPGGPVPPNPSEKETQWTSLQQPRLRITRVVSNRTLGVRNIKIIPRLVNPGNALLKWDETVLTDDDGYYQFRDLHFRLGATGTYDMIFVVEGVPSAPTPFKVRDPLEPDLEKLSGWQLAVLTQGLPLIVLWLGTSEWTSDWLMLPAFGYLIYWTVDKIFFLVGASDVRIVDAFDVVLKLQSVVAGLVTLMFFIYIMYLTVRRNSELTYGRSRQLSYRRLVSRLLLTSNELRERCREDPEKRDLLAKLDKQQDEYDEYMKHQLAELLKGVDKEDSAAETRKKLPLKARIMAQLKGAPEPADYHTAFYQTKEDFFYPQRWWFASSLSIFVTFLCFLVAMWVVLTTGFYVSKIEQEVVSLEVKTKVNPAASFLLRSATSGDVNLTLAAVTAELGYETYLPPSRVNKTELMEEIRALRQVRPDLQEMLLTYVKSQDGVQRSLTHVQKITQRLQELANAGVELGAEYGVDANSISKFSQNAKVVRNWLKSLRESDEPLSPGFMSPIRATLLGTGITAAIMSAVIICFIWFLMFRTYRTNMMMMRQGTFPYDKVNYTPLPAANYIGIQTSHTAFEYFFIFGLLWSVFALISMEAVRVYVWNMIGPALIGLLTVTFIVKMATNLVFTFVACDGRNIRNRPLFEVLLVAQTFLSVLSGIATAVARIIVLVIGFVFFYMRLDTPLLTSPHEHRDPGFLAYTSALFMDFEYNNPIFQVSVEVLMSFVRRDDSDGGDSDPDVESGKAIPLQDLEQKPSDETLQSDRRQTRSQLVRNRWQLFYTLVRNPTLVELRGHAIRAREALRLGSTLQELVEDHHKTGRSTIATGRPSVVGRASIVSTAEDEDIKALVRRYTTASRAEADEDVPEKKRAESSI